MTTPDVLAYENKPLMNKLIDGLLAECGEGEFVIARRPFRWLLIVGSSLGESEVISNAYEMFELESVCAERNWAILYNFCHAAICRQMTPTEIAELRP